MKKKLAVLFLIFSMVFVSCDQDFNTIGADLVGDEHFDFDSYVPKLKAYSVATGEVQMNNMPINPLGFYDNPYFGETKANFVTQVSLDVPQPKFGTSVQIENVTLYVPYFSAVDVTNEDGSKTYTLDSIYASDVTNQESKMKLSVYENGYYLSSYDGADQSQFAKYYSDMDGLIDAQKNGHNGSGDTGTIRLNDSPNTAENDQFFFNKAEIVVYKQKFNTALGILEYVDANGVVTTDPTKYVVKERLAPGIYLTLNKAFFKKKILDTASSNLFNNLDFRQYFKGLYFKMEQVAGQEGAMAMLNFTNAKLNVNYSSVSDGASAGAAATSKTLLLNLGLNKDTDVGNTVSLQDFTPSTNYTSGLSLTNQSTGLDENLYVKGGKGSVVYMDVFGEDLLKADLTSGANGIPDELEELRKKGWLINDAYLEFYVNQSVLNVSNQEGKDNEPLRLYLFDATNQKALVDYTYDSSTSTNTKKSKLIHGGIIQRDANGKGFKYKIRITQYINNIINSSNETLNKNLKLGLCVTENIALTGNYFYKTPKTFIIGPDITYFPTSSILSQQGTILHGTGSTDADKKLKLTIHYTKPN